jgi:protein-S-isoprenylcysteine O-methyltransferase Ste14
MNIQWVVNFSILFFLSEFVLMLAKRSGKKGVKLRNDRKSLLFLWLSIPIGLSIGFFVANHQPWAFVQILLAWSGLIVAVAGMVIRWLSILQLNKAFTVDVVVSEAHQLKTNGMYKSIRHPSYLGLLLVCLGMAIAMNSILSLLVVLVPIGLAVGYRIGVEENLLKEAFGEKYQGYCEKTYRLLPKVY